MRKTKLFFLFIGILVFGLSFALTSCGMVTSSTSATTTHKHEIVWNFNEEKHWQECNSCDLRRTEANHVFDDVKVVEEPTATSEGRKVLTCTTCGFKKDVMIPMLHTHTYSKDWSYDDEYHYHLPTCGDTEEVDSKELHKWDTGKVVDAATESKEGLMEYSCTVCGAKKTETIPTIGHVHSFVKKNIDDSYLASLATCTEAEKYYYSCECGEKGTETFTIGNSLGHSFTNYVSNNDATCGHDGTKTAKCDRCDETDTITDLGTKLEHTYSTEWESDANYHWHNATCGHDSVTDKVLHSWNTGVVTKAATYTEEGIRTYTCSICGATKDETIPMLIEAHTHSYTLEVVDDAFLKTIADCTNPAVYYYSCACGDHSDETFTHGDALGHNYVNYVSNGDATCTSDGTKTGTCSRCGLTDTVTDSGTMLPHTYSLEWSSDETYHWHAATCGCDLVKDKEEHVWDLGDVMEEAGLTHAGVKLYTCTVDGCGGFKEEEIPALPGYTVYFLNKDGDVILSKKYALENPEELVIPSPIQFDGYRFDGWRTTDTDILVDKFNFKSLGNGTSVSFKANYIKVYTIEFKDNNGNLMTFKDDNGNDSLKLILDENSSVLEKYLPNLNDYAKEGYDLSWNLEEMKNIHSDMVFTPNYTIKKLNVRFLQNSKVISSQVIDYGMAALVPSADEFVFDETTMKLYTFTKWSMNLDSLTTIKEDLDVVALYTLVDEPAIIAKVNKETMKLMISIVMPENTSLYSVNLSLTWEEIGGTNSLCEISSYSIKTTTPLNHTDGHSCSVSDRDSWFTYNNKNNTIDFIWNCGSGHSFANTKNLIEIVFETDSNGVFDKDIFSLVDTSIVIYGDADGNLSSVVDCCPVVYFYE